MIGIILSILGIAALIAVSFAVGCISGCLAVIDKLADGNYQRKLEICDKLKKNNSHITL